MSSSDWELYLLIGFAILVMLVSFGVALYGALITDGECRIKEARDYCESQEMFFDDSSSTVFTCVVSERSADVSRFRFTEEELDMCRKELF